MPLSKDLISQFVKSTKDTNKKENKETFVTGEIVGKENGQYLAKIYGSATTVPVTIPTNVNRGKPVNIMIKNHTAHVIGNISTDATNSNDSDDVFNDTSSTIIRIGEEYINNLWSDYYLPGTDEQKYTIEVTEYSSTEEKNNMGYYFLMIEQTFSDDMNVKEVTKVEVYDRNIFVGNANYTYNGAGDLYAECYVALGGHAYRIIITYTKNN